MNRPAVTRVIVAGLSNRPGFTAAPAAALASGAGRDGVSAADRLSTIGLSVGVGVAPVRTPVARGQLRLVARSKAFSATSSCSYSVHLGVSLGAGGTASPHRTPVVNRRRPWPDLGAAGYGGAAGRRPSMLLSGWAGG